MPIVKVRERGQMTIPAEFRRGLGLEEDDALNVIKADDVLILTRKKLLGDAISVKFERAMKKRGITLDALLDDLRKQRARYSKEARGAKAKT